MPHSEIAPVARTPRLVSPATAYKQDVNPKLTPHGQRSPLALLPSKATPRAGHGDPSQMKRSTMLETWYSEGRRENLSISELLHRSTLR